MQCTVVRDKKLLCELEGAQPPSDCTEATVLGWLLMSNQPDWRKKYYQRFALIVVRRYCHPEDVEQPTFVQIGEELGVTKERVRHINTRALNLLRSDPSVTAIIKSRVLVPGTRLYLELFGTEDIYDPMY